MAFAFRLADRTLTVEVLALRPVLRLRIDGREHTIETLPAPGTGPRAMTVDGAPLAFVQAVRGGIVHLRLDGRTLTLEAADPRAEGARGGAAHDAIHAPMPGAVVSVEKRPGDRVLRGETVLTIESMKLQTALLAPRDGVLAEVLRQPGETFEKDAVVARLEPET
jgi:3-methylcrotonyl-CoA carboxylase alpha subunit